MKFKVTTCERVYHFYEVEAGSYHEAVEKVEAGGLTPSDSDWGDPEVTSIREVEG